MSSTSITATESFRSRAQRSEARRLGLWAAVLAGVLALTVARRLLGGVVMSADMVFVPAVTILAAAIVIQLALLARVRRANRNGTLLPVWTWPAGAVVDLAVPTAMLTILVFHSPRGAVAALSGPSLLLLPMVVLLSVLRLRPRFTLAMGLAAAAFHLLLAAHVIAVTDVPRAQWPVLFSYGFALALTGAAAMLVAQAMRGHVMEAAEEAAAREQANLRMAAVRRDLAVARDIQAGLLPAASPDFPGFDVAGMNRPADLTGGDYFDWQPLPDGRLVVVLADVTGHGIGPALVMAVCRAYARASAAAIREPAPLMRRLNELLLADLPADRFITLAVAMLHPSGRVELLSAGHGPSFLYRAATEEVMQFGGDGLPLGVAADEPYEPTAAFDMADGDVLVLLTDGFFEWQRPGDGEAFGIPRLHEALLANVRGKPDQIIRGLDGAVRAFAGDCDQPDDMTVVVIKRTASERANGASVAAFSSSRSTAVSGNGEATVAAPAD